MPNYSAILLAALSLLIAIDANATDACRSEAIRTQAEVSVSDGTDFQTETWYHLPNAAAIRHIRDEMQLVAIDGPYGWAQSGDSIDIGNDFYRQFAIGHQFHAILLRFDDIVKDSASTNVQFGDVTHDALSGVSPHGGTIALVLGEDVRRPVGLLFNLPGAPRIEARFSNWQTFGELQLPSVIVIDDTEREFEYRYSNIAVTDEDPLWYFEAVPAPNADDVAIYRLHRRLLAAHCLGDAEMMANLSLPETVIANRGVVSRVTRETTSTRFKGAFERFDYTAYTDILPPAITVSESGDLGWAAVNVIAKGTDRVSGEPFEDQWAWIMMMQKIDGRWLHAGNASNRKP